MKRIAAIFLSLLAGGFGIAYAQHDSRADVLADIERAGGVHYLYPTDQPAPTAPPKGYKPFYLSHLGRHGARFALGETVYEDLLATWHRAHDKGWLTPEGETIYAAYCELYPDVALREGILTRKGQEQHRFIAGQIWRNFPALFRGQTRAEAVSTVSHRVIVSMFSFLSELDNLDRDFRFEADYGQPYQQYLLPEVIDSQAEQSAAAEQFSRFRDEVLDLDGMLARWFTRPDSLVTDKYQFCRNLHTVVSTLDNLDTPVPERLYTLFSPEERYALWRADNFRGYLLMGRSPRTQNLRVDAMRPLWEDFLAKAEADWQDGVQLRLRFAHDSTLMPFLSLLDVNGMGARLDDPAQVENAWRSFDIPMGCNLQLVFFRNKKNPDILVQVLLNGREATLPLPMAAPGSFYRWEDIRNL